MMRRKLIVLMICVLALQALVGCGGAATTIESTTTASSQSVADLVSQPVSKTTDPAAATAETNAAAALTEIDAAHYPLLTFFNRSNLWFPFFRFLSSN